MEKSKMTEKEQVKQQWEILAERLSVLHPDLDVTDEEAFCGAVNAYFDDSEKMKSEDAAMEALIEKGKRYDADVSAARQEGILIGRNESIDEVIDTLRPTRGVYQLSSTTPHRRLNYVPQERLGALSQACRKSIWEREF